MNSAGYALWTSIIRAWLDGLQAARDLGSPAPT
jgi:hypothetical protein